MKKVVRAAVLGCLAFAASPALAVTVLEGSGEITASDPTQNGRVFRDAIASTWDAPKPFPGVFPSGPEFYDNFDIDFAPNEFQDVFYEITVTNLDAGFSPHSVAYDSVFDADDISVGYVGDIGTTPDVGETLVYQVIVGAGGSLILNFSGVNGQFGRYEFTVDAFSDANRNEDFGPTGVIPEPASWAMMIAGFGLVGGAMRRRSGTVRVAYAA